jgi:hypothetical protein
MSRLRISEMTPMTSVTARPSPRNLQVEGSRKGPHLSSWKKPVA